MKGRGEVVAASLEAWARQDLEGALSYMDDDVVFTFNAGEGQLLLAGACRGKDEVRRRFQEILDLFDFQALVLESLRDDGETIRTSMLFYYRHKASGLNVEGRYRQVMRVEHGRIVRVEEFHDAAAVNAFLKLATETAAKGAE
jgi:ketosteroid isomerase-like protein